MKRTAYITGIILLTLAGVSCSDDFLEKNNAEWYSLSDTLIMDRQNYEATVMFELPEKINGDFTVFIRPVWLTVDDPTGDVREGKIEFKLSLDGTNLPSGYYSHTGAVVLEIEDFGYVSFTVIFTDYGSPSIQCSPTELVFDGILTRTFTLTNPTPGILDWTITEIPDWLAFSVDSGVLYQGQAEWITVTVDASKLVPGVGKNTTVRISSPHAQYPYMLKISVTPVTVPPPEGFTIGSILADAEYHHESGILAVCTSSPNQLILYNTGSWETDTIELDRAPGCISISEDGHTAVIGYSVASVSYIDLDAAAITDDFSIDCIPHDIVLGDNGWCYITPVGDQWEAMHSLDLNTGQLTVSTNISIVYEKTQIKKVPGKALMVGSRLTVSPTGLLLFDIAAGLPKDEVTYYHESTGDFWISKDAARVYSAYGNVYTIPEFDGMNHGSTAPVYGMFDLGYSYISTLDDCPAINSVFYSTAPSWHEEASSSLIEQYNSTSLIKTKSHNVSVAQVSISGNLVPYETTTRFIFLNKEGTSMYVLKVIRPDYKIDGWLMETIAL